MNTKTFGVELRRFRKRLGLTQGALGQRINMSQQQIGKYETGLIKTKPSIEFVLALQQLDPTLFQEIMREGATLLPTPGSSSTALSQTSAPEAEDDLQRLVAVRREWRARRIRSICAAVDQLDDAQLEQFSHTLLNILRGISRVNGDEYAEYKKLYND